MNWLREQFFRSPKIVDIIFISAKIGLILEVALLARSIKLS